MNKELLIKILDSTEESKLAALYEKLNDEERSELESLFDEDKKTATESNEEDSMDVEKIAADYYAAGKLFAQGFLDELGKAGE